MKRAGHTLTVVESAERKMAARAGCEFAYPALTGRAPGDRLDPRLSGRGGMLRIQAKHLKSRICDGGALSGDRSKRARNRSCLIFKGEIELPTRRIVLPDDVDVKQIRNRAGMSQAEFARAFCINPRTLQDWEQGRRKPDATTRAYLSVIAKNRNAVLKALAS